ncbi:immunoglobulin I-set domain protein, partial [Ancylostoma duodenale]
LQVEKEAAPPRFVNTLKDQECKEGEVISFECEVEGWPEPELVWLVDDQPLRPSHDFKIEYDGMNAKLEIRDAQPDDTGVYCVKIQNEFGTAESKAELTVIPDPDKNHVAPEFQATIEDVECDEGDEVRFKSVITGDPNPDIIWMINGIPLTESEKIRFISEDGICILIIKDVTRHFDGTVTCQVSGCGFFSRSLCSLQFVRCFVRDLFLDVLTAVLIYLSQHPTTTYITLTPAFDSSRIIGRGCFEWS